jgi:hypothetical protein
VTALESLKKLRWLNFPEEFEKELKVEELFDNALATC